PPVKGLVARAVLQTSEGRGRYFERMATLLTNIYHTDAIVRRIDQLNARLHPFLAEEGSGALRNHERAVEYLRQRVIQRGQSVHQQLAIRPVPLDFGSSDTVRLSGWKPKVERGNATCGEGRGEQGQKVLKITAAGGYGSWRTEVLLGPGQYEFSGQVQVHSLSVGPNDS